MLESVEAIDDDRGRGHRAVYRFEDIDQLTPNQNPSGFMPQPTDTNAVQENVRFQLRRGTPARLRVSLPQPEASGDVSRAAAEALQGEMLDLARQLYSEMKISLGNRSGGHDPFEHGHSRGWVARHRDGSRLRSGGGGRAALSRPA